MKGEISDQWLHGHHVVVTSGGTREPIDPIRYISNRSSGKMGAALVEEALRLGAKVTLITTVDLVPEQDGLSIVRVETTQEMCDAVHMALDASSLLIMAAAPADYRPRQVALQKIKKGGTSRTLDLVPTVDILASVAKAPRTHRPIVVGFAAETENTVRNASAKLVQKKLDLIVTNDVSREGIGMGADDNAVTIIGKEGVVAEVTKRLKAEVAQEIFTVIQQQCWVSRVGA